MLWIMPFLGLYLMLMLLMPVPEAPYGWQFVRNIYAHLKESFLEISQNLSGGGREDYDLSLSGFTEDGELAGALGRRDREIMTIESSAPLATNVYLTGKVYDTFDGRRWLQSREDTEKERYADTARTLCALAKYEEDYQQDYLLRARIKISYRYFHTSFLFAPLKLWELQQKGDKMSFREQDGSFLLDRPGGYGTEYEAVFYQMNGGQEAFYHFLQEGRQTSDEKLPEKILKDLRGVTWQEIRAEDLAYQRQRVYDTCLKETALSENVRDALLEMTQGAETDVERLRAIEASLASLNYTRSPGELPDVISNESEFLDYFLLESRQGYCNYFATAFVLLARAQGIPARYVTGYAADPADFSLGTDGLYHARLTDEKAHAWAEIYLGGPGWLPVEVTPPAGQTDDSGSEDKRAGAEDHEEGLENQQDWMLSFIQEEPEESKAEEENREDFYEEEGSREEIGEESQKLPDEGSSQSEKQDTDGKEKESGNTPGKGEAGGLAAMATAGILVIVSLAFTGAGRAAIRQRKKRLLQLGADELYQKMVAVLHLAGYGKEFDGTEQEFCRAIIAELEKEEESEDDLGILFYSENRLSFEELEEIRACAFQTAYGREVSSDKEREKVREGYEIMAADIAGRLYGIKKIKWRIMEILLVLER